MLSLELLLAQGLLSQTLNTALPCCIPKSIREKQRCKPPLYRKRCCKAAGLNCTLSRCNSFFEVLAPRSCTRHLLRLEHQDCCFWPRLCCTKQWKACASPLWNTWTLHLVAWYWYHVWEMLPALPLVFFIVPLLIVLLLAILLAILYLIVFLAALSLSLLHLLFHLFFPQLSILLRFLEIKFYTHNPSHISALSPWQRS